MDRRLAAGLAVLALALAALLAWTWRGGAGAAVLRSPAVATTPAASEAPALRAPRGSERAAAAEEAPAAAPVEPPPPAAAAEPASAPTPLLPARVRGLVLDAEELPVAGCILVAGPELVRSGRAGDFELRLELREAGKVRLVAQAEGFAEETLDLQLAPGQVLDDLVVRLARGGSIEGEVLDRAGRGEAGVQVGVGRLFALFEQELRASTDALGRFRFDGLRAGVHAVQVQEDPEGDAWPRRSVVDVRAGGTTRVVLGGVAREVRVVGRVLGLPADVEHVDFGAVGEGADPLASQASAELGPDGGFELLLRAPGAYVFYLETRRMLRTFDVEVPERELFELELRLPGGRISGLLLDALGQPVAKGDVRICRDGFSQPLDLLAAEDRDTAEDGSWSFDGLDPGTYAVHSEGCVPATGLRIAGGEALAGIVLRRGPSAAIRGRILGADGAPLAGASVFAFDAAGRWLAAAAGERGSESNEAGRFELTGLAAGSYRVAARASGAAAAPSAPVQATPGATPEVELRLEAATRLRLVLRERDGTPVRALWSLRDASGCEHAGVLTAQDLGRLFVEGLEPREPRFGPLAPGRYRVAAHAADGRTASAEVELAGEPERRVELKLGR